MHVVEVPSSRENASSYARRTRAPRCASRRSAAPVRRSGAASATATGSRASAPPRRRRTGSSPGTRTSRGAGSTRCRTREPFASRIAPVDRAPLVPPVARDDLRRQRLAHPLEQAVHDVQVVHQAARGSSPRTRARRPASPEPTACLHLLGLAAARRLDQLARARPTPRTISPARRTARTQGRSRRRST